MYDLHCHSLLSDGVLLPSEVAMRYLAYNYKTIAITDHVDYSNIDFVIKNIINFARKWPKKTGINILPGIELTHIPCGQFKPLSKFARKNKIKIIIAHGQTTAEPVFKGTNLAALEADIDILAHPGLITKSEAMLAKKKNIFLEITARKGHRDSNTHVARIAKEAGTKIIINSDSHSPKDILPFNKLTSFALKAGLNSKEIERVFFNTKKFIKEKGG